MPVAPALSTEATASESEYVPGEPLVWNIETLKKQVDCNATNWAHVRRTVLDKAKSEINGHTDIYFDYEVYEKDRQRVIAVAVTIEPVDKQVADDKLNEITKSMSSKSRGKKKLTPAETGSLDDDPSILTLEYVSVPETTIPYSYGATPDLLRQELEVKAELDKLNRELTADEMEAVHTMIGAMVTDSTAEQMKISSIFSSPPSRMGHVSTMSSLLKNIMPSISHCAPEYR